VILPPAEPVENGSGAVVEVLVGLTVLGAAALAALAVLGRRADKEPDRKPDDGEDETEP
jgi:hypothetical protein